MLKIHNINKSFGDKKVLHNMSSTFDTNSIHGVIGSNGAGKSTLFRCICGLENYKGSIIHEKYNKALKNNIAYLATEPYFYPKITGQEYLEFHNKIAVKKGKWSEELNTLFDLPLDKYVENYSTGMKKKIAFLANLILNRSIYILDEPFNGLDLDSVLLFKSIILKLKSKNNIVLISSHIISSLTDICDDIQYLNNGSFIKKYMKDDYKNIEGEISSNIKNSVSEIFGNLK